MIRIIINFDLYSEHWFQLLHTYGLIPIWDFQVHLYDRNSSLCYHIIEYFDPRLKWWKQNKFKQTNQLNVILKYWIEWSLVMLLYKQMSKQINRNMIHYRQPPLKKWNNRHWIHNGSMYKAAPRPLHDTYHSSSELYLSG